MHVWIVEIWDPKKKLWMPTNCAALTPWTGEMRLNHRKKYVRRRFRLRRYERSRDK